MTALSRVVRGARVRRRDGQQLGGEGSAGAAMTPLNTEVVSRAPGLLVQRQTARFGPIGMEQLWNRGGATGGKSSGRQKPENRLNWRQTVADGCHRLPFGSHGKEGVSGSSPEEGSAKSLHSGVSPFTSTCSLTNVRSVWSRLWSFQVRDGGLDVACAGPSRTERCVYTNATKEFTGATNTGAHAIVAVPFGCACLSGVPNTEPARGALLPRLRLGVASAKRSRT
jgi:hypothetical protein